MSFIRELFTPGGELSKLLRGYEVRPQQVRMAESVQEAIDTSRDLMVEAGTGVGKSLAYLVPFVKWAVEEDKRIVVSTYTRALQNQLYIKDIPFVSKLLNLEFSYALCMGSDNYLCRRKLEKNIIPKDVRKKRYRKQIDRIIKWSETTDSGLVTDLDFVPDKYLWSLIMRESDACPARKCGHWEDCPYWKARRKQSSSQVLVANHSLLFADMLSDATVLPEFDALVLDEAHTLEDIATKYFAREINSISFRIFLKKISDLLSDDADNPAFKTDPGSVIQRALDSVKEMNDGPSGLFERTLALFGDKEGIFPLDHDEFFDMDVQSPMVELSDLLYEASVNVPDKETSELLSGYAEKCLKIADNMAHIFRYISEDNVYWVEVSKRKRDTALSFHASPVDISERMKESLFSKVSPVVMTSATLSTSSRHSDFSFVKSRLGVSDPMEMVLDSPFDYSRNVILYLPREVPDPATNYNIFKKKVKDEIVKIYEIMGGRIFTLFTSYDMLNTVCGDISEENSGINILKQGDMPRYVLLDVFRKRRDSILMGTSTFWQGVDVPGEALECVIITKLPFSVPSDPVNAARIDHIRRQGLNPFTEYQVPQAIIMFKQGFGRLIRSAHDRGIVAILDPRVSTKYYGRKFIESLPECGRTSNMDDISCFFNTGPSAETC